MRFAFLGIVFAAWIGTGPGTAAPAVPQDLSVQARLEVASVSSNGILAAETGQKIVLAGVRLPARLETSGGLQAKAVRLLRERCIGREVTLLAKETARDRWGRYLAHLRVADAWIQAAMVEAGLAVVEARSGRHFGLDPLLDLEETARRRHAGVWGAGFRVRRADEAMPPGGFAIVQGRVADTATVNGNTYLNFGENWKTDFTVMLDRPARRRFDDAGMPPNSLQGAELRVRGVLEAWNGPLIRARSTGQVTLLTPRDGA